MCRLFLLLLIYRSLMTAPFTGAKGYPFSCIIWVYATLQYLSRTHRPIAFSGHSGYYNLRKLFRRATSEGMDGMEPQNGTCLSSSHPLAASVVTVTGSKRYAFWFADVIPRIRGPSLAGCLYPRCGYFYQRYGTVTSAACDQMPTSRPPPSIVSREMP